MSKWWIYSGDGIFNGVSIDCPAEFLSQNVPDGFGCIIGPVDVLSQRVDMASGLLVDYKPPQPSADHVWDDSTKRWVYVVPLSIRRANAVAKCYVDIDAVYADAVGNRTEEYKDAESDARAFKATGYTGTVSDYVHDFALHNPTGAVQTDQWAADQIIARADAFASAKLSMRSQRFASQSAMRAAATDADLDTAVAAWNSFISSTRLQLGL